MPVFIHGSLALFWNKSLTTFPSQGPEIRRRNSFPHRHLLPERAKFTLVYKNPRTLHPETKEPATLLGCGLSEVGDPTGIRTPVTAVKGRCPRPLDDGVFYKMVLVGRVGFEPTTNGLKGRCSTTELPTRALKRAGNYRAPNPVQAF